MVFCPLTGTDHKTGFDACPMEGIQPAVLGEVLELKNSNFKTVVTCVLGYQAETDKYTTLPKVRCPKEEVPIGI